MAMLSFYPAIILSLYLVFLAYKSMVFFLNYPIATFFSKTGQTAAAVVIICTALLVGRKILSIANVRFTSSAGKNSSAAGLGFGVLSLCLFMLGLAGWLQWQVMWLMLGMSIAATYKEIPELARDLKKAIPARMAELSFIQMVALFCIAGAGLCALIASWAPPTYYDSLVYHLAYPASFLREGRVFIKPYAVFGYFPENMEMLFSLGLGVGGDLTAKMLSCASMMITLTVLYVLLKTIVPRTYALAACVLFITSPSVLLLASGTYVEMGLTMYVFLSVYHVILWWENSDRKHIILAGLFGGFAFGTKYTGIIGPTVLAVVILFRSRDLRTNIVRSLEYAGTVTLAVIPWLLRNTIALGNPFFPFFTSLFGPRGDVFHAMITSRYFRIFKEYSLEKNIAVDIYSILFNTERSALRLGGGFDVLGDFGWTLPFLLLPALIFMKKSRKYVFMLIIFVCVYLLVWVNSKHVGRYLVPLFPAIILLNAVGLRSLCERMHLWFKYVLCGALSLFIISNIHLYMNIQSIIQPWNVALGIEDRDTYLSRKFPDYYPAVQFINNNLPLDAKVYIMGDQRGYYCKRTYESTAVHVPDRMVIWANAASDARSFVRMIRDQGFSHIFYNQTEARRLRLSGFPDFSEKGLMNWNEATASYFNPIFTNTHGIVYQITPTKNRD